MHRATPQFWSHFDRLPEAVQRVARRNFRLLQDDPRHPSLHFKKVNDYWVVRTGRSYRAVAIEEGADLLWVWIGGHDEYMRIINR